MTLIVNLDLPTITDNYGFMNWDFENYYKRMRGAIGPESKWFVVTVIDGKEDRYEKEIEWLNQIKDFYKLEIEELSKIEDLSEIYKKHFDES